MRESVSEMVPVQKVHKDGAVKVPLDLLKEAGLKPGVKIVIQVANSSLIIERAQRSHAPRTLKPLRRLRGRFKHIDWDAVRHDVRARWSAWRDRLSA